MVCLPYTFPSMKLSSSKLTVFKGLWGSYPFSGPECHGELKYDPLMADIWSLGVLYISMILGDLPWDSATPNDEAFSRYFDLENNGRVALMALIPPDSRELIGAMLNLDAYQRPNMVEVFANPWIRGIRAW